MVYASLIFISFLGVDGTERAHIGSPAIQKELIPPVYPLRYSTEVFLLQPFVGTHYSLYFEV